MVETENAYAWAQNCSVVRALAVLKNGHYVKSASTLVQVSVCIKNVNYWKGKVKYRISWTIRCTMIFSLDI